MGIWTATERRNKAIAPYSPLATRRGRLMLERRHNWLGLIFHPDDQHLRRRRTVVAHGVADVGSDVLDLALLQERLRAVLLFEHERTLKAIDQFVAAGMN